MSCGLRDGRAAVDRLETLFIRLARRRTYVLGRWLFRIALDEANLGLLVETQRLRHRRLVEHLLKLDLPLDFPLRCLPRNLL